jgi:opacity protein-like surface antigen
MLRKTGLGFFLSLVFVLFTYSSAVADTPVFNSKDGKLYGSINAGVTFLNDIGISASASGGGYTLTATADLTFDEGASFGGALGYVISDFVRAELELGFASLEHDKVKGTLDITSAGTTTSIPGEAGLTGDIDTFTALANVILTPLGNKTIFGASVTPLVGAGIGFVDWEDEITGIVINGVTTAASGKADDTDLLVSIMTGLEYTSSQQVT